MSFAKSLLIMLVIFGIGLIGYQIGVTQAITAAPGAAPAVAPVAYGYYPWGYGPGAWMGPGSASGTDREHWVAEMHRRLHEAEGSSPTASSGGPGTSSGPDSSGAGTPPAS